MSPAKTLVVPPRLHALAALAVLLEKLERQPHAPGAAGAGQYRAVVARLQEMLAATPVDASLSALLDTFPALAELYENLHYEHAGLVRSPLDAAVAAETAAQAVIALARRGGQPADPAAPGDQPAAS